MTFELLNVDDSFAVFKDIPAGEFDVVLTDPPYNAHVQENMISGTAMKHHVAGGSGAIPHLELPFAPLSGFDFARDLVRVAKRWAISFCAIEDFGSFRAAVGEDWVKGAIWYKPNAQGQMTGDRPASCCEGLALMRHGKKDWNGRGSYGFWPCNGTRGEKDRHPNQKSLELCLKLVALFTNRGETVFDPFCGSGRIGEACLLLGRNYVGFDLPPHEEQTKTKPINRKTKLWETVDWVARARARLRGVVAIMDQPGVAWTDAEALKLCTAKKSEVVEDG
jgi:hypothetical protein